MGITAAHSKLVGNGAGLAVGSTREDAGSWLPATANRISEMVSSFKAWRGRERTYNELTMLSDRQLEDIGIHRSQIRDITLQIGKF